MKKLFVSLSMVVMMFTIGVILSACGSDMIKLKFSIQKESEPLVDVVVKQDNKIIEGRGLNYNLQKGINLRVEIVAKRAGVDFSQLVVKVDGANKSIIKNKDYSCAFDSEDFVYGNFTLPSVDEDINVSISGVKEMMVTYDFEVENVSDETAIANMKNAFIEVGGEFCELYAFATNPESTLNRYFTQDDFNSFKIRFANPEKGDFIFDLRNSVSTPFKVRTDDGKEYVAEYDIFTSAGFAVVKFPNIKEKHYIIVVDFKDLSYEQYTVVVPEANLNYSVTAPEVLNYMTSGEVTLSKSSTRTSLVYDEVKVYLNDLQLELAQDCDLQNDSNLRFVIPDKITPFSTSIHGEMWYTIRVDGISYADESYSVNIAEGQNETPICDPKIYLLNEEGERLGLLPKDGERYVVVKGEKLGLAWDYKYDNEKQCFVSQFDFFDFNVVVGDVLLIEEEIPPVETMSQEGEEGKGEEEKPEGPKPDPNPNPEEPKPEEPKYETKFTTFALGGKLDLTLTENQTVQLDEKYALTAFYDEEKKGISGLQLEFDCENDKEISFSDFKNYEQEINVSFDFVDERVTKVEFMAIENDSETWITLEKGEEKNVTVFAGQKIVFKLTGSVAVDDVNFKIQNEMLVNGAAEILTDSEEEMVYTQLYFTIFNYHFADAQNFKLVVGG